jgi:hypothetical protein
MVTFLQIFHIEILTAFIPDSLLKDVCIANNLGRYNVSLQGREQI